MGKILVIKGADFSAVAVGKVDPATGVKITVVASPTAGGTVSGGGKYNEGDSVTITATLADGYKFSQWNDGNKNATRTISVGSTSQTYTATFVDQSAIDLDDYLDSTYTSETADYKNALVDNTGNVLYAVYDDGTILDNSSKVTSLTVSDGTTYVALINAYKKTLS